VSPTIGHSLDSIDPLLPAADSRKVELTFIFG
jgi:hypothetical protein